MNFREWLISEMPMTHFKAGPFQDSENLTVPIRYINQADEKVLTNQKTAKELERVLAKSTHFNFNIIIAVPQGIPQGRKGFYNYILNYCKKNEIPTENHITFGKNSSTGEPLTAWMILHNLGHAILETPYGERKNLNTTIGSNSSIKQILSLIDDGYVDQLYPQAGTEKTKAVNLVKNFKFKSARYSQQNPFHKFSVPDTNEVVFELMAEYLWHGFIRSKEPDYGIKLVEKILHNALQEQVGKIILDYN